MTFDAWKDGQVAASQHEIELVAPKPGVKLETVSSRLKGTLPFPVHTATIQTLRFSPDGRRLLAGSYPGGTVQLYDVETGRQLVKIETGRSHREWEFCFLRSDWKTLIAPRQTKRTLTRAEKDGKKLLSWECEGELCAWDLDTGNLKETFRHSPPRGIFYMKLASDGRSFLTLEELSGESDTGVKRSVSLGDVQTKQFRVLPENTDGVSAFSADAKTVALSTYNADRYTTAIKLLDTNTAEEKLSFPITEKLAWAYVMGFAPDGHMMVGSVTVFSAKNNWQDSQHYLKLWDTATGKELASFAPEEKNDIFLWPAFSPDGKTLLAANRNAEKCKLYWFDVAARNLVKTIVLGDKSSVSKPVFSPDGKWLAVVAQAFPEGVRSPSVDDVPQARIHLLEMSTGEVRETLIAPPGFPATAAFSPDGKTLVTGGHGKVLLWDLSMPPGTTASTGK